MTLVTHAAGGAAASLLASGNPILAFIYGFASHFILDAIPHWHYPLRSFKRDETSSTRLRFTWNDRLLLQDILITGLDCALGFAIAWWSVWHAAPELIGVATLGAIGGILPDFLQLIYYVFPNRVLNRLQRFHVWIHTERQLDEQHFFGIGSQAAMLMLFAATIWYF